MIKNIFYILIILSTLTLLFFWHTEVKSQSQEVMLLITGSNAPYKYNIEFISEKEESGLYHHIITTEHEKGEIESMLRSKCKQEWTGSWSCDHMIDTFYTESNLRNTVISETSDYGICQVNHIHKGFFKTKDWRNIERQVQWCIGMWNNAFERGIHPSKRWYAYR